MTWPFCPTCGAVLALPEYGDVECGNCKAEMTFESFGKVELITQSAPRPLPRWVEELENKGIREKQKRATVDEQCPKCGHPEMEFYTMQLRSADEGQTVFYECLNKNCQHKFSVNN
ncbi:transcription factor S-II-domain-containing protein [Tribonema minus]|uniref:DNA-directed RNA polymerase subunit n=1 Tax=Tribonema minus TaxID=303371 RepID=A0A836CG05_9STRA|nr:transcription factor S-II-domain-containing protein [Tribonema minus]